MRVTLDANCGDGKLMQFIARHARIESQPFDGGTTRIEATLPAGLIAELSAFGDHVRIIAGPEAV